MSTYSLIGVAAVSVSSIAAAGKERANQNTDNALIVAANRLLGTAALVLGGTSGKSSLGKGGGESGGCDSRNGEESGELHPDRGFGRRVTVSKS